MDITLGKKLDYLAETKDLIKAALIEKGQSVGNADTFRSYADKILAIPLVINGAGVETDGNLKIAYGSFQVSADNNVRQTVTHGLGEMPDFVCVCAVGPGSGDITGQTNRLISAWGFNSRFENVSLKGAYSAHGVYFDEQENAYKEACWGVVDDDYGMDKISSSVQSGANPWIYTPDDAAFEVGANSTFSFIPEISYRWIAMAGLGAAGGSGGSVAGVHYVTFLSEDGATELYKRPVADGDDCADPVERGLINAPAKESTARYDYSFVGWATARNGAWDENALNAVTEDKTVYAAFASILRYYTITYYDSDGTTVLKTERLGYGATPSYEPEKDDYDFAGWSPAAAAVTGDASYTATWAERSVVLSGTFASGATWSLQSDGVLTFSGTGAADNYKYYNSMPWYSRMQDITSLVVEDGVTSVGTYSFYTARSLASITLSESVVRIEDNAFHGCESLTSATVPGSVVSLGKKAFANCTSLENVTLQEGLTTIENMCFAYTKIESITIPGSVTYISSSCFGSTNALNEVTFADTSDWYIGASAGETTTLVDVTDPSTNATYFKNTYLYKHWTKV